MCCCLNRTTCLQIKRRTPESIHTESELLWNSKGFTQGHFASVYHTDVFWCMTSSTIRQSVYEHVKSAVTGPLDEKENVYLEPPFMSVCCVGETERKVSSLSIALATPVSSSVVHIAILWVGYHRNCPSQTWQ